MKRYEKEALVKSFLIFFLLQMAFLAHLMWHQYNIAVKNLENHIASTMKICSLDLQCKEYTLDFVKNRPFKKDYLYKDNESLFMLFHVPTVKEYLLKIILNKQEYNKRLQELKIEVLKNNILYILFIFFSSLAFALYSLYPLKKALDLNKEFIKDILHDINTPIAALLINLKLLKKEFGVNKRIERAKHSIETIVALQNNLKAFLGDTKIEKEHINLKELLANRVNYFHSLYPHIKFELDITNDTTIYTNKESFIRILDNIIENSCKYAKEKDAYVKITLDNTKLIIEDNGIGIKDTRRVFDRYYKEHSRGLGLGMHIVEKLSKMLLIDLEIKSKLNEGTKLFLDLRKVILH